LLYAQKNLQPKAARGVFSIGEYLKGQHGRGNQLLRLNLVSDAMDRALPGGDVQPREPRRIGVVTALGITQIFAWGCSYYLPAVLAKPISTESGWPLPWVVGGVSIGLFVAGLVSPIAGRTIQQYGGRAVLASSSVLLAIGLVGIGLAQNLIIYLAAWVIVGLGMGAGLYDAAFATLGRIYLDKARSPITTLTLFGGFSSTICWPLSGLLVESVGWRSACLIYAGLQLAVSLPIYLLLLPSTGFTSRSESLVGEAIRPTDGPSKKNRFVRLVLVAAAVTLSAIIQSTMAIHLLTILQAQGVKLAAAVALGTLVGPSQVLARVLEMIIGRHFHPIWTMLSSTVLVTTGLVLLSFHLPVVALGLVFFGAGMGIMSIARGTVPLVVFGAPGYAVLMGQLAAPSSVAQAISPLLGAVILDSAARLKFFFLSAASRWLT
jgi:predicted MFS family arabinose efflux permease